MRIYWAVVRETYKPRQLLGTSARGGNVNDEDRKIFLQIEEDDKSPLSRTHNTKEGWKPCYFIYIQLQSWWNYARITPSNYPLTREIVTLLRFFSPHHQAFHCDFKYVREANESVCAATKRRIYISWIEERLSVAVEQVIRNFSKLNFYLMHDSGREFELYSTRKGSTPSIS